MNFFCKALFLLMSLSAPVFSNEVNSLKDACGYVALTSDHIKGLDSWNKTSEIYVGAGSLRPSSHALISAQNVGLVLEGPTHFSQHESLNHLAMISFDDPEEMVRKKELIAERSGLNRSEGKVIQLNTLPKIRPSVTAMGAPKK